MKKGDKKIDKDSIILDLQNKLAEKEEILLAIQTGKIDVLVSQNEAGVENIMPLKGAELSYQQLIESMNEGAITLVEDGTIFYCNNKFSALVKKTKDEIINTKIYDYLKINDCKSLQHILKNIGPLGDKRLFKLIAHDNSIINVYFSCNKMHANDTSAIMIVVTDVTEIQEAEERYATLVENAAFGLFVHDFDGIIIETNKIAEKILARTKNEILGCNLKSFLPPNELSTAEILFKAIAANKFIGPREGHFLRPNGQVVDVIFSVAHITLGGKKLLLGMFSDMTEYNRLRSLTFLNDKLTSIGKLASGIIHEINNPMTWIITNLLYVKENLQKIKTDDKNVKQKLEDAIEDSIQGSNKIKEITQNIKGFIRVEDTTIEKFDINELINSAVKMASPHCKYLLKIEIINDDNMPLISTNKNKLHQVFLNIIINAIDAMDENQKENKLKIKSYYIDNHIYVDFTDTGKGMSPDVYSKIFEPFFTTKPRGVGTGLGLPLCSDIIQSLGGSIAVKSVVNEGSTFSICLPLQLIDHPNDNHKIKEY